MHLDFALICQALWSIIRQATWCLGEFLNLLRFLKSKRTLTLDDRRINLRAFNVVSSISLQQVDVVAISNDMWISFIHTIYHCVSCWDVLEQKIKSVLIAEIFDGVAKYHCWTGKCLPWLKCQSTFAKCSSLSWSNRIEITELSVFKFHVIPIVSPSKAWWWYRYRVASVVNDREQWWW